MVFGNSLVRDYERVFKGFRGLEVVTMTLSSQGVSTNFQWFQRFCVTLDSLIWIFDFWQPPGTLWSDRGIFESSRGFIYSESLEYYPTCFLSHGSQSPTV